MKNIWICSFCISVLSMVTGCGNGRSAGSAEMAKQTSDALTETGRLLMKLAEETQSGPGPLLILTQKEEGVLKRPDLEHMLAGVHQSSRDTFSDIKLVQVRHQDLFSGQSLPAGLYETLVNSAESPNVILSLLGIPIGHNALTGQARNIPLIAMLPDHLSRETLHTHARLPDRWVLIESGDEQNGPLHTPQIYRSPSP